jgi:Ca-activated chloride channel homolog
MDQKNYSEQIGTLPYFARSIALETSAPRWRNRVTSLFVLSIILILGGSQFCRAESGAAKNNKGNHLFAQGKYEDAEKSYLSAQGDDPGKPEILYNLGNSLIKQKKYREGVQALGQSTNKGDKEIKEKGWYNTGNAFFSAGNYRDSAAAFIEALKLDPADKDAKHNLELALLKLKQQEQDNKQKNQKQQDSKDSNKDKPSGGKDSQAQPPQKDRNDSGNKGEQKENEKHQQSQSSQREGSLTRDQALRLLDAVQNQELKEQRQLLENRAREKARGKDW